MPCDTIGASKSTCDKHMDDMIYKEKEGRLGTVRKNAMDHVNDDTY